MIFRVGKSRNRHEPALTHEKRGRLALRLRNGEGQSLVETAFTGMVLMVLFFGTMEMSLALYTYHFLSQAARQATRYAMVRGSACAGFSSACPATSDDVQNYVRGLGYPGITPSLLTATTTWPTTGAACTPSSNPCNNPGNVVNVKVQYAFPLTIPSMTATTLTMSSTSQVVISQ